MKGQGLVEYALILVLIVVVVIVCLALITPVINGRSPCTIDGASFACKQQRVNECMASEGFTKDQCVTLMGGGGE